MTPKKRLDAALVAYGQAATRSQAANLIQLGMVKVNGKIASKPGQLVSQDARIEVEKGPRYVSRAAYKLESVAGSLGINFHGKTVLDVGSSTGGFTDYALQHGAKKVVGVDVGSDQLHPRLRTDERVELHEQTDIRDFVPKQVVDIVTIDVSFISLRQILPYLAQSLVITDCIVALFKPQFEAGDVLKHKGVVKNEKVRRQLLRDFEAWVKRYFVISGKMDSAVKGAQGNQERFYLLRKLKRVD